MDKQQLIIAIQNVLSDFTADTEDRAAFRLLLAELQENT